MTDQSKSRGSLAEVCDAAFDMGDYGRAVALYRQAADQGDAVAQNNLGICYAKGYGVEQDYTQTVKWFEKSADQGYGAAQNSLGVCYAKGYGVEQDYTQAVSWFEKSADQGYAAAQNSLGVCYGEGHGVEQDYKQAVKWHKKAADQGYAAAQSNLVFFYATGLGVEKNFEEAAKLSISIKGDDALKKKSLDFLKSETVKLISVKPVALAAAFKEAAIVPSYGDLGNILDNIHHALSEMDASTLAQTNQSLDPVNGR